MTSPLLSSLASTIGKSMAGLFLDATLVRDSLDLTTPWAPTNATPTTYAVKAIHDEWGTTVLAGGLINAGERKVLVLASTLPIDPLPGDRITIRGETFTVVPAGAGQPPVSTDPAKAVWVLRCAK